MKGRIKKITDKGFGFIVPEVRNDEVVRDIFFHMKEMQQGQSFSDLQEGDIVEFDTYQTEKGINASEVRLSA